MRFVRPWFALLLAAVVVALSWTALAGPHYFCRMAGRVMADCCCEAAHSSEISACGPSASPADCCERIQSGPRAQVGRTLGEPENVPPASLAAVLAESNCEIPDAHFEPGFTQPSRGPPPRLQLFIVHCALLI